MNYVYKTMIISLITNTLLLTTKFIVGIIINSKTLVADAFHSLSDLSTDFIAIVGQKLSTSKADVNHPYGHGKVEYITSLIIGIFIMVIGFSLIVDAFSSKTGTVNYGISAIILVLLVIVTKYGLACYVLYNGKKHNNSILLASGRESMADVLSSIGVLITILLTYLSDYVPIFKYGDKIGCIIISIFIIKAAFNILKDNIKAILGEDEQDNRYINNVKEKVMEIDGVFDIDNINLIKFGSYYNASLSISINKNISFLESHNIASQVEKTLLNSDLNIKYVIVHTNPQKENVS